MTWRTISRVHNANSKDICRGSRPTINAYSRAICDPRNFGGRPGTGFAFNASLPPPRYLASQPYTVLRCKPSVTATSSGCAPASTCSTARILGKHRAEFPSQQMGLRPPARGPSPTGAEHQPPVNAELGAQLFHVREQVWVVLVDRSISGSLACGGAPAAAALVETIRYMQGPK
jgi:hypothetical protein